MHHLNLEKSILDFSTFLEEDNAYLRAFQEQKVLERAPRKESLIEAYTKAFEAFRGNDPACRALPEEIKTDLRQKVQKLQGLTEENCRLLKRLMGAHQFYLKTLTRLTCEKVSPQVEGYGALGRYKGRRMPLPAFSVSQET